MRFYRTAATAASLVMAVSAAGAAETQSVYTDLNLDECLVLNANDFGASFACPGYKGFPLWVAESGSRFFVSYGFGAPGERAAQVTLASFNYVHSTVEWRLSNESGNWKPFATILRWFTQTGDGEKPDGEILVVTKLEKGNTCHIAYIDARLTPDANEVARNFADNQSEDFDCATDDIHLIPS